MFKISIDPGYGFVKSITDTGHRICFPSLVSAAHDRFLDEVLGTDEKDSIRHLAIEYDDGEIAGEFFVGDLARESRIASYAYDENKINHINTKILIATATAVLAPDQPRIWVGAGLPLEHYRRQREELQSMLTGFEAKIRIAGRETQVCFEKVSIFPQGVSSVYDALLLPNERQRYQDLFRQGHVIASINWGMRTVDVVAFKIGKSFRVQPELSFTLDDFGAMEIRRWIQRKFSEETGSSISLLEAEQILYQNGFFFYKGMEYDFSHQIVQAKKNLARLVFDAIKTRWGNQGEFIRTVFFSGGTVQDIKDRVDLHTFHPHVILADDPQFADARGVLHMMRMQERKEREPSLSFRFGQ